MKVICAELRKRIVKRVRNGMSVAEAVALFDVSRASAYRILKAGEARCLEPKIPCKQWHKLDPEKLKFQVAQTPDATLEKLDEMLGVSHNAVAVRLRKLGITPQKKERSF